MCSTGSQDSDGETALQGGLEAGAPLLMSHKRGLSPEWAMNEGKASGSCPRGAQGAGAARIPQERDSGHWKHRSGSFESAGSKGVESAFGSSDETAWDLLDPEDRRGTKHRDLPQGPDPAGHNWRDSNGECEIQPRKGKAAAKVSEDALGPQDGSATKGTELPQVQDPGGLKVRDLLWESETRPRKEEAVVEIPEDALGPQDGSAAKGTELPQVQDPVGHREGEAASLLEQRESCPGDGTGEKSQDGAAMGLTHRNNFRGCLAPVEWIRSHPRLTLALLALLLLLAVVFGLSLAAVSVVSDTPQLLACPHDWVGYRGVCYFLSKDHRSWDQAQARCSELGASLAVLKDWEMKFLFRLTEKSDHWLGLRRQDQGLQWVDGSSFNSSVPVLGTLGCLFLAEDSLRSEMCSSEMCYVCSRAQSHL